jgi:LacI family gluconate utilization system Gnt-I transcriptional repressor
LPRHLLSRGHKRIAFAAAQLDPRTLQRLEGRRKALLAASLYDTTLEWLNPAPSSISLGARMFEQIMGQQPAVDAIFLCNDDLTGSGEMLPPLTTVRTPRAEIGSAAAKMLLALMRGETVASPCMDLGYELLVRGGT